MVEHIYLIYTCIFVWIVSDLANRITHTKPSIYVVNNLKYNHFSLCLTTIHQISTSLCYSCIYKIQLYIVISFIIFFLPVILTASAIYAGLNIP